jgi:DNA topoisomerase-2
MTDSKLATTYQIYTDIEHVLNKTDTYLGSIEKVDAQTWILNNNKIVEKNIEVIPGLINLVNEAFVNARDHAVRMKLAIANNVENSLPVTYINVTIQPDGTITVTNDGNGIDISKHPENGLWIPEMILGHLRSSTNYNADEKKIVGGKNGLGFKLISIYSTYVSIETVDHVRGLKYTQEFKNNLSEICKPIIVKCKTKPYTTVTFKLDFKRLGVDGLAEDTISLLRKRLYDIAAVTDKNVKVKYNNELIPVKTFQHYIDMYIGEKSETARAYEENGERWEYAVGLSPNNEFVQVSFVNGIHTTKGGKHVEYILNQIVRKLGDYIETKKKIKVNPNSIKEQLILFMRCDIENPAFDSQTKDFMNTPSSKFGSKCEVTDKFIEKIAKMGVMDTACAITKVKEIKIAKKTDGSKSKNIRGIPKLTDANWAGTAKSGECILILCEGDSAKAGVLSGLLPDDRNNIGIYPLKGKVLNVNGESSQKITANKEITELKQILGLENGKEYKSKDDVNKNLRYGQVLFMTDQDLDGSHIKGLCINLFHSEWHTLTEIPGFIGFMNTPILKAKKGANEINFYNDGEYEEWKKTNDVKGWNVKYYKGLGTSTGKEFREYFTNKKIVGFEHTGTSSDDAIDMVFNKKRADDRKVWLGAYNRESYLDTSKTTVSYKEFIDREFIHFSKYDCDRSIPNLMDGLKISLRKIVFAAFKKNLISEIKVAQFSGYVSEHSCYHHGEASLNQAIKGLAQNFVGSNNINLLVPSGQFGTRLKGGDDSASERYIFTYLNKLTRCMFHSLDDPILQYQMDDGTSVEPRFFAPIIPFILVNGSKGIGTGFSTDIMAYNPLEIIDYLKQKLQGNSVAGVEFTPYYEGFTGTIDKVGDNKFLIKGKYETTCSDTIRVVELPVGYWTDDFKEHLEALLDPGVDKAGKKIQSLVKEYADMSKDTNVDFTIVFAKGKLAELELATADHGCNGVHKLLKLCTTNTTNNMHLFDANDKLKKYASVADIIDDYFVVRLSLYQTRKDYMIAAIQRELLLLDNKAKYVQELLDGTIDLRKKTKDIVHELLVQKGYAMIESDYKYLTRLPMDSVTEENVNHLSKDLANKQRELGQIQTTTIHQMWSADLDKLRGEYLEYKETRNRLMCGGGEPKKKVLKKQNAKKNLIVESSD